MQASDVAEVRRRERLVRRTDSVRASGTDGSVGLSLSLLAIALLWTTIISCARQDAAHLTTPAPNIAPTASAETDNAEGSRPRVTPTPYARRIPSPVVVTATATLTATAEVAATTTAQTVVATPTQAPLAVDAPTSLPTHSVVPSGSAWSTPKEIYDRLDWGPFIDRGYFLKRVPEGKSIRVYLEPKSTRKVTCSPDIGTAFDSTNPTWSDSSHWVWVWVESGEGLPGCWGLSRHEDWMNKPLPAKPLTAEETRARHTEWGEDLKFALDDSARDFSVPPRDYADGYPHGSRKTLDDGWHMECDERSLPWAGWTNERGFYTVSLGDEEAQMRERWTPEQAARKEEARSRGWYFIAFRSSINQGYCWQVPNHEEIPPHRPCLRCQWRGHG